MEIYVIRHTKLEGVAGLCYGQTDLPLSNTYLEELGSFKERIPKDIDKVISSPLKRCTYIAEQFSNEYQTDNRLMEMNFGAWEMSPWNNIPRQEIDKWTKNIVDYTPEQGESLFIVQQRLSSFLTELRKQKYQKVLLVTHAGVIRCIWNYLLNTPLENTFKIPVNYYEILGFHLLDFPDEDYIFSKK